MKDKDSALDEAERRCFEMLRRLHDEYAKQAEPYIQQLAKIHAIRPPSWTTSAARTMALIQAQEKE